MPTRAELAAERRKKAKAAAASEPVSNSRQPESKFAKPRSLKEELPTTKLYEKRVPFDVTKSMHRRMQKLSYENDIPINVLLRALIDETSDSQMATIAKRLKPN